MKKYIIPGLTFTLIFLITMILVIDYNRKLDLYD